MAHVMKAIERTLADVACRDYNYLGYALWHEVKMRKHNPSQNTIDYFTSWMIHHDSRMVEMDSKLNDPNMILCQQRLIEAEQQNEHEKFAVSLAQLLGTCIIYTCMYITHTYTWETKQLFTLHEHKCVYTCI